ncbi:hypothetical protein I4F81_003019 [Pyropia yezoensis]|uniref:Uncharacterized protein n=1 Tax=Pyropia yezoensis TaxID=2788 RepID=A0ACC3BR13_PYRYE|nr:hypothetical protein I4F81_003019 [Neopyropia yezoensis]
MGVVRLWGGVNSGAPRIPPLLPPPLGKACGACFPCLACLNEVTPHAHQNWACLPTLPAYYPPSTRHRHSSPHRLGEQDKQERGDALSLPPSFPSECCPRAPIISFTDGGVGVVVVVVEGTRGGGGRTVGGGE